eukprot:CAMPEP_0172356614 /NCGR_PEP_ID=MMETSP1060-20121228/1005_1 /TAXON_ID=37318 /ORGANISM="Pseudo-nitzschia pungens, Strain cf. cingulata" /LENGTH=267 /DNA_ID=CAMNT_0013076839 /DNA_START=124 /DNA_END=927 /DNA_ORIENTATION=+
MTECCCKKIKQTNDDDDDDDDIERCFLGTEPCICVPYNDGFVVAAQIMSIVAVLMSWFWWVTFIISIIAMVILQVLWCCRQRRALFLTMSVVSAIAAIMCAFSGGFFLIVWKRTEYCYPFIWEFDDYFYNPYDDYIYNPYDDDAFEQFTSMQYDGCNEKVWASVAFLTGILWLAVTGCIIAFVCTGRYAKWERKWEKTQGSGSGGGSEAPEAAPEPTPEATEEVPVAEANEIKTKEEETKTEEVASPIVESDGDDEEPPDLKQVASA